MNKQSLWRPEKKKRTRKKSSSDAQDFREESRHPDRKLRGSSTFFFKDVPRYLGNVTVCKWMSCENLRRNRGKVLKVGAISQHSLPC